MMNKANQLLSLVVFPVLCLGLSVPATGSEPSGRAPFGLWLWSAEAEKSAFNAVIEREGKTWSATLDGEPIVVSVDGRSVRLGNDEPHYFVGELNEDGTAIEGLWHQQSTRLAYSHMVTPVTLSLTGPQRWTSPVALQPRPFRIFLDVFEDEEGGVAAVVRNPERNQIMRATRFRLEETSQNAWDLVAGSGEREIRRPLTRTEDGLRLDHPWFDSALIMRQARLQEAVGYYPRPPSKTPATYTPPAQLKDGWVAVAAEDAGFDRSRLDAMVQELASADPRVRRPRLIHGLLVAHKGRLVVEEYFHGYDRETVHETRSLAKVFAPVLVGALQKQGATIGGDTRPIPGVLAEAGETLDDRRKEDITLGQLMAFSSGLDCDVARPQSPGNEDNMWSQDAETDFWLYASRLPLLHEPGERYAYCSASINLVGASLRAIGGKPIVDLFDELIAKPLGFSTYHWNLAPNGAAYLGGGVYMRPRDVLKIGAMFAANGRWKETDVIDPAWIKEATTEVIAITPETTGMSPEDFSNNYFGGAAAYEWRIDEVRVGERTYRSYEATGNGGQVLLVVPELELTALFMGGNYFQGSIWGRWRNEIIGGHVIPAMTAQP